MYVISATTFLSDTLIRYISNVVMFYLQSNEDVRKVASDVLIAISSSSIEKSVSSDTLHQKLARMVSVFQNQSYLMLTSNNPEIVHEFFL